MWETDGLEWKGYNRPYVNTLLWEKGISILELIIMWGGIILLKTDEGTVF